MVLNTFHVASRELDAVWRKMRKNLVLTAGISLRLAELAGVDDPEDYYVLGLLHNLGEVAMLQWIAARVARGDLSLDLLQLAAAVEVHHESFGRVLAHQWGLPMALSQLMAHHHRPVAPHGAEGLERSRHIVLGAWKQALAEQYTYFPSHGDAGSEASVHFAALNVDPRRVRAASAVLAKGVQ
jgi:HD-like signal output (HDOD) protein